MTHYSIPDEFFDAKADAEKHKASLKRMIEERMREAKRQQEAEMLTATLERLSSQKDDKQRHFGLKEYVEKVAAGPKGPLTGETEGQPYRDRMLRKCPICKAVVADEDVEEHALWHEDESERLLAVALDMMQVLANLERNDG